MTAGDHERLAPEVGPVATFDRVGRAAGLVLVFAIFAAQLAWSPWWLARFHLGPLEWVFAR